MKLVEVGKLKPEDYFIYLSYANGYPLLYKVVEVTDTRVWVMGSSGYIWFNLGEQVQRADKDGHII